jgi:hypothetical protein
MLRLLITAFVAFPALSNASDQVHAQAILKIGAVQCMTGPFNDTGKSTIDGVRLYIKEHGSVVADRKIEVVIKDDGRARGRQTPGSGPHCQRQDRFASWRYHAFRTQHCAADGGSQNSHDRHGVGFINHRGTLALYRAHRFYARPIVHRDCRMGNEE